MHSLLKPVTHQRMATVVIANRVHTGVAIRPPLCRLILQKNSKIYSAGEWIATMHGFLAMTVVDGTLLSY